MFSKGKDASAEPQQGAGDYNLRQMRQHGKPGMPSIVSEGLHVTGNMISDGDVQIDGMIEGDVKGRHLTIGSHGGVVGKVIAEEVMVSGSVTGEIHAKIVTLARSARVQADITHESLAIESGAQFEGRCKRTDAGKSSRSSVRDAGKHVFQHLTSSVTNDRSDGPSATPAVATSTKSGSAVAEPEKKSGAGSN